MVVNHARRLHDGIADSRADKAESSFFEIMTHLLRLLSEGWRIIPSLASVGDCFVANKTPYVFVKCSKLFSYLKKPFGVVDSGLNLLSVSNNASIF